MKKITRKLSMKYVKLNKSKLRQEGPVKSEEDGGEFFREIHSPEHEESSETKETPRVTKLMESMHRKLMLNKDKANKKNIDGDDESQMSERSVRNGGRDRKEEGSVRTNHMQHLEDLIRDHMDSPRNTARDFASKTHDQSEGSKTPSDFASKKDYLDWIEYVEGSSNHCFDRSERAREFYRRDDKDLDLVSVGISEGSIDGNNDEMFLLKSSKFKKNEKVEDSKGYKKLKGNKSKGSLKKSNG